MMIDNISAHRQNKIVFSTGSDKQSIEIGQTAIDDGLLRLFPGPTLAILIYLLTHLEEDQLVYTNPTIIASFLPLDYDLEMVREGLEQLEEQGFITIPANREGNYTYGIRVNLDKFSSGLAGEYKTVEYRRPDRRPDSGERSVSGKKPEQAEFRKRPLRNEIENLTAELQAFLPEESGRIEQWLADFEPAVLKELIRRVNKWRQNNGRSPEKAAGYLLGIIDDWYQKGVFTYQRLQHFDRLYRETKELAECYGINDWHNLNPVQLETFRGWLSGKNPLSLSVARLAIQEAIRRKKDSQPSLKYIEDNFINPWKKARIKNTGEARIFLKTNNRSRGYQQSPEPEKDFASLDEISKKSAVENWDKLDWEKGGKADGY